MSILKVENLKKRINNNLILDNINFEINNKFGLIGLFGPNGSGKTTLLKILATATRPTEGNILIDGTNKIEEIRKKIGVVFQVSSLDPEITVLDNMIFHSMIYLGYVDHKKIDSLLKEFGLEKYVKYKVKELSGGNRRRLEIIRCLIHDPKIILLDEPDNGLDPKIRKSLWSLLNKLKKRVLIILITHNIDEVESICDTCVFLNKGKIVNIDSPENIKKRMGGRILKLKTKDNEVISYIKHKFDCFMSIDEYIEIFLKDFNILTDLLNYIDYIDELSLKRPSLSDYLIEIQNR